MGSATCRRIIITTGKRQLPTRNNEALHRGLNEQLSCFHCLDFVVVSVANGSFCKQKRSRKMEGGWKRYYTASPRGWGDKVSIAANVLLGH